MNVSVKGFIYHKDAESFQDCFDRYAVNTSNHKFCVSDGVSQSFFPGIWAELLVENFVNTPGAIDLIDTSLLRSIQKKWNNQISEIANRPNQKYYVRNFFAEGRSAAATFVGLNFFHDHGKPYWEAFALGDSFLFFIPSHIQHIDKEFNSVTYLSSKVDLEFDNFPDFFHSKNLSNKGKIKQIRHELVPGTFFLMTDALSEWLFNEKQIAINEIQSWTSQRHFEQRIALLRKEQLQNDDSAILIIKVEEDTMLKINYENIEIADLKKLAGIDDINVNDELNRGKINSIEQKFLETPKSKVVDQPVANYTSVPSKEAKKQKYLLKKQKSKKKNRGFWERKIDVIAEMFSMKKLDETKNLSKEIVNRINEDRPQLSEDDSNSQNIDAITNKF